MIYPIKWYSYSNVVPKPMESHIFIPVYSFPVCNILLGHISKDICQSAGVSIKTPGLTLSRKSPRKVWKNRVKIECVWKKTELFIVSATVWELRSCELSSKLCLTADVSLISLNEPCWPQFSYL